MFLGAFVFGRRTGAIAGGIGMSLFDLISGWAGMGAFYPCNCSSYGICFRPYFRKTQSTPCNSKHCCGNRGACCTAIVGYYFTEVILYGNWIVPFGSIPGNIVQVAVAGIIVIPFAGKLKSIAAKLLKKYTYLQETLLCTK